MAINAINSICFRLPAR